MNSLNDAIAKVSLVVPVFNEQTCLTELIQRCLAVGASLGCDYELILVDDGSSDDSARIIQRFAQSHAPLVTGVLLYRNFGQHSAVLAGLARATGDVIVTLDADLQNPPEEIPKLLAEIARGADVVGGVRERRSDSRLRIYASRSMNALMRTLTRSQVTDYGCMLRAYRRPVVDAVLRCQGHHTYVPALANAFAAHVVEVPVEHAGRSAGKSSYNFARLLNLYFDLVITSTTTPLRVLSILGSAMAIAGTGFGVLLLTMRLVLGSSWAAEGVLTVIAVLFVMVGIQLLGLGLIGEYVGRISRDTEARPRFLVREVVGGQTAAVAEPPPLPALAVVRAHEPRGRTR
jgi:undecaprenyl-phosphate 4-deoxy-4-formamido-L-arabinose transferase